MQAVVVGKETKMENDYKIPEEQVTSCNEELFQRNQLLGKWLWILFWLIVPNLIGGVLSSGMVTERIPALMFPGQLLRGGVGLAYAGILLKLKGCSDHYRISGWCCMISAVVNICDLFFSIEILSSGIFMIALLILSLVGEYHEYYGHADVLTGIWDDLSQNWKNLWKWNVRVYLGTVVTAVLVMLVALLGLLAGLVLVVGLVSIVVLKLVYLYRMAKYFREQSLMGPNSYNIAGAESSQENLSETD